VASRPHASDSLRSAHGRKDTLSKNTRSSVFILRIFRQFVISSGFHFSMIAQFKVKCGSNPFALCAIATILLARSRGCHSGLAGPLLGLHKTSAASYCIARSLYHHPPPHTSHKTVGHRPVSAHELSLCRNSSYFGCSQNRNIRTVPCLHYPVKRLSMVSFLLTRVTIPFGTFVLIASLDRSTFSAASLALTDRYLIRGEPLVVRETLLVRKMSVTFGAGDSDVGEGARKPSHKSLHVWSQMCVASLEHALLHALHINLFAVAPVIFTFTRLFRSTSSWSRLIRLEDSTCPWNTMFSRASTL